MAVNLASEYADGGKFAAYTVKATGSATVPVQTYSATTGPDSTPGVTLSATGSSGGVETQTTVNVGPESALLVSVVLKASSETPDLTPIQVQFYDQTDGRGNSVLTYTPVADGTAASTSAIQYSGMVMVPDGAYSAVVTFGYLHWSSTGGYTVVVSSPGVVAL